MLLSCYKCEVLWLICAKPSLFLVAEANSAYGWSEQLEALISDALSLQAIGIHNKFKFIAKCSEFPRTAAPCTYSKGTTGEVHTFDLPGVVIEQISSLWYHGEIVSVTQLP